MILKRCFIIIVLLSGSILLLVKAGTILVRSDDVLISDALVVLMGSNADRVLHAADLYTHGTASKVLVVRPTGGYTTEFQKRGVYYQTGADHFKEAAIELGIPANSILILPGNAESTLEEAIAVADYLRLKPSTDTITIITSPSHTLRTGMIFRKVFHKTGLNITLQVSATPYSDYKGNRWWKYREESYMVFSEWLKIIVFLVIEQWTI